QKMCKNVQKCAVPYDAGKNWNLTIFTGSEFYAPFTSHSFIFFMIQNFIIHIGSPAGFGTDRTAARHANKAWPAAVVLFLDELVDLILRVYLKTQNCTKRQEKDIKGFYHRQYKEVIA